MTEGGARRASAPVDSEKTRRQLRALLRGVALVDHKSTTRMHAGGKDFLPLLGRLSTGEVATIPAGELRSTVLTTTKGRIVAQLLLWPDPEGVRLLSGAGLAPAIAAHIARFTFAEKVDLRQADDETFHLALIGPQIRSVLDTLKLERPDSWRFSRQEIDGASIDVIGHDGYSADGISLIGAAGDGDRVRRALSAAIDVADGCEADDDAFHLWRILMGLPASGHELTEEFNPLEAGLDRAISFTKGCYVGQEVIARLHSYNKVSRRIVGIDFGKPTDPADVEARIKQDDQSCGVVTSLARLPGDGRWVGLGYVKLKALERDSSFKTDDGSPLEIVDLPFPASYRS